MYSFHICLQQGANDLHMVQVICHCHPIIYCFIKIHNGLPFLVPAYAGCPAKEAVKRVSQSVSLVRLLQKLKSAYFGQCQWRPLSGATVATLRSCATYKHLDLAVFWT